MANRRGPQERLAEGNALAGRGRYAEAAQIFRGLVREHPAIAELHFNLANALKGGGEAGGAERAYRKAIELKPTLAEAHFNLANLLRAQSRPAEAADFYVGVLALEAGHLGALLNFATMIQHENRAGAEALLRRCLILEPAHHGAANLLGLLAHSADDLPGGDRWLRRAVVIDPNHPAAWSNLGDLQQVLGRFVDAHTCHRSAIALQPGNGELLTNLGIVLLDLQRPDAALPWHRRALAIDARQNQARWNGSLASLAVGDLARGWAWYESRFDAGATAQRAFDIPRWAGEPLAGRRLLIWREQGIGDEMAWAGCFPDALAAGPCVIECEPRLVPVIARSFPAATVRADTGNPRPRDADCHVPMGSLPLYFRPTVASFPRQPVLVPDPVLVAKWRARVTALGPGCLIGFSWRSMRARLGRGLARSYSSLPEWRALFALPGVHVISLQYDDDEEERRGFPLVTWPDLDLRRDMDDVMALASTLDGIVSPSNSVGSIAGCVGRPSVELAFEKNWSLLGTTECVWYAAVTPLLRTAAEPDWSRQIEAAIATVKRWRDRSS